MMTLLVPIMCLILTKDGVLAEDGKYLQIIHLKMRFWYKSHPRATKAKASLRKLNNMTITI